MRNPTTWFTDLDSKVELALRPFGKARVDRCAYEDAFEVILYNPPTDLYITERFTVETLECVHQNGGDVGDWLAQHLAHTFPRRLNSAWDFQQHEQYFNDLVTDALATPPNHISTGAALKSWFVDGEHTIQAGKGKTRHLQIGQYIGEYRVIAISRSDDTFCIKSWI